MLYRIFFYFLGLTLATLGLITIIVYLSFSSYGFSFLEKMSLILKTPSSYLFIVGSSISLIALFYDLIKTKK